MQQAPHACESRKQSYWAEQRLGVTSAKISHPHIPFFLPSTTIIPFFLATFEIWRENAGGLQRTQAARLCAEVVFRGGGEYWYLQSSALPLSMAIIRFQVCVGLAAAGDCFVVGVWEHAGKNYRNGYSLSKNYRNEYINAKWTKTRIL